jgi:hypothetical protein
VGRLSLPDNAAEFIHAWVKAWIQRHMVWANKVGARRAIAEAFTHLPPGYCVNVITHIGY